MLAIWNKDSIGVYNYHKCLKNNFIFIIMQTNYFLFTIFYLLSAMHRMSPVLA